MLDLDEEGLQLPFLWKHKTSIKNFTNRSQNSETSGLKSDAESDTKLDKLIQQNSPENNEESDEEQTETGDYIENEYTSAHDTNQETDSGINETNILVSRASSLPLAQVLNLVSEPSKRKNGQQNMPEFLL